MWQGRVKGPGSPVAPIHQGIPNSFSPDTPRNFVVLNQLPARPAASPQQTRLINTTITLAILMPNPKDISRWGKRPSA